MSEQSDRANALTRLGSKARLPPIDVPALLGRFRDGYGIGQLSAWCGHGQGAIEDVLREALRGQMREAFEAGYDDGGTDAYRIDAGRQPVGKDARFAAYLASRQPAPPADRETGAPK